MAYAFDTLSYAKRLRESGVLNEHAEAHAEAAREFIMTELVTKPDLQAAKSELQSELRAVKSELQSELRAVKSELQSELRAVKSEVESELQILKSDLQSELRALKSELQTSIDTLALRLTVRFGGIAVAGVGALALLQRLHSPAFSNRFKFSSGRLRATGCFLSRAPCLQDHPPCTTSKPSATIPMRSTLR